MATLSSIANRLSVFLPEMKFPLLNFHEPAFAYGPASRNLHCSPKLPPKHSRHIGISRYLFLRGQWRSLGGARTKDSPPERFKSIRFSAFEIRISARSRASVAQVLALNFLAFGTFPFSYTYGISRRSRCRFLSPSLSLSSSSSLLLSVSCQLTRHRMGIKLLGK